MPSFFPLRFGGRYYRVHSGQINKFHVTPKVIINRNVNQLVQIFLSVLVSFK